jgi:guanylate kinase
MSLPLSPGIARARGPVAACVTRCLGASQPSRAIPPPSPTALAAPGGCASRGLSASSSSALSSRSLTPRVPPPAARLAARAARFSAAASADGDASDATAAIRAVEERLGVTLCETPTVPSAPPVVVVISGPSGVGKDAVLQRLLDQRPELSMVVTATDRAPRPGETDGVDYHFTTTENFEAMIANDELVEHAVVYGQHKGIPKRSVRDKLESNSDVVLRLDVQGAATVRAMMPDAVLVFLCAESEAALARRLFKRGTESPAQFARRDEPPRRVRLRRRQRRGGTGAGGRQAGRDHGRGEEPEGEEIGRGVRARRGRRE